MLAPPAPRASVALLVARARKAAYSYARQAMLTAQQHAPWSAHQRVWRGALLAVSFLVFVSLLWLTVTHLPAGGLTGSDSVKLSPVAVADMDALVADDAPPPLLGPTGQPLTHLVLVACHAVLVGTDIHSLRDVRNWALLDYQRGQLDTFVAHIKRGVQLARDDPQALLIFSGGETRAQAGPRSEAVGYWTAASHAHWFTDAPTASVSSADDTSAIAQAAVDEVSLRAATEEFARDSFENLLFSMCRFREVTGAYPTRVTVVGFSFKAPRFTSLHRAAIRFPESSFAYVGIDPPMIEGDDPAAVAARAALMASEQSQSVLPFEADPYGCFPPLSSKKRSRNPFHRSHGYGRGCPEIKPLLKHCKRSIFEGPLPWSEALDAP